jgi:hypothetical protein
MTNEDILYWDGATNADTGTNITPDSWQLLELRKFVFATPVFDIVMNSIVIKSGGSGFDSSSAQWDNKVRFNTAGGATGTDFYIDNFIVRQFLATEPAWGTWGAQES